LKRVEKESLLKSFFLFFFSQALLLSALFYLNFQKEQQTLDEQIFSQMRICSLSLHCKDYKIDFVSKKGYELYRLYKEPTRLSAYFTIPGSQKNYLRIYLEKQQYDVRLAEMKRALLLEFLTVLVIIALLSLLFALYALRPMRNALHLTEEFIRDILHDFNTPLSTLRLNIAMLADEVGENKKILRAQNAVQNILNLQANLRSYLHAHSLQKEQFLLYEFLLQRIDLIAPNYRDVDFRVAKMQVSLETNPDAFSRIIDNLLSNAAKYNKKGGSVSLELDGDTLLIKDTGKGIANPSKVFERFYKEQARGMGIGLHIVKKLSDELNISINLESQVDSGTSFYLNLHKLIKR
jgi:signal transduction histidine kinase